MAERCAALGIPVEELKGNQLRLGLPDDPRRAYAEAKQTLAITVAPPSKLKLQPIAPSADWRVDLAEGCPAHCSYCYLAGSLGGPPITRAYANLPEITGVLPGYLGQGRITSRSVKRAHEGTTFEASCYTDPLALEHLTGSLSALVEHFGRWEAPVQLRFTSKFAAVEPLLGLEHNRRTRMRASVNPPAYARFEGGTDPVAARLAALRRMADAGYPIGLTVAPIIAAEGWEEAYGELIDRAATALDGARVLDLTVELITHRFTAGSREVLTSWYPGSDLDMTPERRTEKRTKFGGAKFVYPPELMTELKRFFHSAIAERLPEARILYWT
jgi:spore photoproduct lyase